MEDSYYCLLTTKWCTSTTCYKMWFKFFRLYAVTVSVGNYVFTIMSIKVNTSTELLVYEKSNLWNHDIAVASQIWMFCVFSTHLKNSDNVMLGSPFMYHRT